MIHNNLFSHCIGFEWDAGNDVKSLHSHRVTIMEAEQVFFNLPFYVRNDLEHSVIEERFFILGETNFKRRLFIVFTIRNHLIRIISARDMNKKEKELYEKMQKNTQI